VPRKPALGLRTIASCPSARMEPASVTMPTSCRSLRLPRAASALRSALVGCAAMFFVLILIPSARAQDLPADIITSASPLSTTQDQTDKDFPKPSIGALKGDDAIKVRDGRLGLVKPLLRSGIVVGIPFRQAYSKTLGSSLDELVKGNRPLNAINALRVAAELA